MSTISRLGAVSPNSDVKLNINMTTDHSNYRGSGLTKKDSEISFTDELNLP